MATVAWAVSVEMKAEAGDKAAVLRGHDLAIQTSEQVGGSEIFCGERAQSANDKGASHGSFEAFTANITNDDET